MPTASARHDQNNMLTAFFEGVLPVFGVLAVGFAAGRLRVFDAATAAAINRFVVLVAVPLLVFRLLARVPYHEFDWMLLIAFFVSELLAYAIGFFVARTLFGCELAEAVLLGLASCFANHLSTRSRSRPSRGRSSSRRSGRCSP